MKKGIVLVLMAAMAASFAMGQTSVSTSTPPEQPAADRALYAVGNLGSTQLYYTYMLLGILGDSYAKGVYDKQTALSLLGEVTNLTKLSKDALGSLQGKGDLTKDDETLVSDMNDALDALLTQAEGLSEYVDGKDDGSRFQSSRKAAWQKISTILGLEGVKVSQ